MGFAGLLLGGNPLAFTRRPVTCIVLVVYIGLLAALLAVHHSVPTAPTRHHVPSAINLTEAWLDLQFLSKSFHPYNSRSNDHVREWLLARIESILESNDVKLHVVNPCVSAPGGIITTASTAKISQAVIYNDVISNATFTSSTSGRESVYFEGNNIIVYIPGADDGDVSHTWDSLGYIDPSTSTPAKRGVLVNAHYDSVSTGYGATDDGVGVVTILQLIRHYTTAGHQPERGVIALLNNGEEDYLNGAHAFAQHPSSKFPDTFVNLEGAGAGGRATLFRSTDAEVTKSYQSSPYPFGTVVSADGFKQGLVRSATDYSVFTEIGLRGLDVAFMEPRSLYHTSEDSSRRTSEASMWHMLSAALATTQRLTLDTTSNFSRHAPSQVVYFDLFGRAFVVLSLRLMFALSISLLVVSPLVILMVVSVLHRRDKWYLFSVKITSDTLDPHTPDEAVDIAIGGWRGFSRYPLAFVVASAATAGIASLYNKINPYIVYCSPYAVWSTLLSTWFVVSWIILRGADYIRASALHRAHALGWLFAISWCSLLLATVAEARLKVASGYLMLFFHISVFLALMISYLEFSGLPKRVEYGSSVTHKDILNEGEDDEFEHRPTRSSSAHPRSAGTPRSPESRASHSLDRDPTERTSLLHSTSRPSRSTSRQRQIRDKKPDIPYRNEQAWSSTLPSSFWTLQFLLLAPINLVLIGQVSLFLTSALAQTPADGSKPSTVYYSMAALSVLLLIPLSPFMHRISSRVPLFLFAVLVGTAIYGRVAFPFSDRAPLKVFFLQRIDLETGHNNVTLTGLDGYVQHIVTSLPSAAGANVDCTSDPAQVTRPGLTTCSWPGLAPNVVPVSRRNVTYSNGTDYSSWLTLNATRLPQSRKQSPSSVDESTRSKKRKHDGEENKTATALFRLSGLSTRACRLLFYEPLSDYTVTNSSKHDTRFVKIPDGGVYELRLWSREWDRTWEVEAQLKDVDPTLGSAVRGDVNVNVTNREGNERGEDDVQTQRFKGKAVCMWSDANDERSIPALTEVRRYMPVWSVVSKAGDGLVEGFKAFEV